MKAFFFFVGSFVGSIFAFPVSYSSTPDGETPAVEHVCDDFSGAAYGLCNAYCEAMDCDDDPNADEEACDKLEDKFTARTGKDVPCGYSVCDDFKGDELEKGEFFCESRSTGTETAYCLLPKGDILVCRTFDGKTTCKPDPSCKLEGVSE